MLQNQPGRSALARRATAVLFSLLAAFWCVASLSQQARSQTYKVIHTFTVSDGATPYGGPILDQKGNLYGTTYLGGSEGSGTVYKLSPHGSSWVFRSLYSLKGGTDGSGPAFGSLAISDGALFGTTEGGLPFGTAFEVSRANPGPGPVVWNETVVHHFGSGKDGAQPIGGVVFDAAGNFYGTTSEGGANSFGNIFEVKHSGKKWIEKVLYDFKGGNDAANPPAGVTLGAKGNLYGTSSFGGTAGVGAIYKLQLSGSHWKETILYNFQGGSDGQNPVGGVVLDKAGNLYGGTFDGGVNGGGTVYKLSHSGKGWKLTTLYSFTGGYGGPYNNLTFDAKGNIYGATNGEGANGDGSVFKLSPAKGGWTYTDLYDFTSGSDGGLPYGSVAVDARGNIFGTASLGGSDNQGVVFQITP
jgi:uncharacterized repeat protein (TIGR03803 family)